MWSNNYCCNYRCCTCIGCCKRCYISCPACCQPYRCIIIRPGIGYRSSCIWRPKGYCCSCSSVAYYLAGRLINLCRRINCYRKCLCRSVAGYRSVLKMWRYYYCCNYRCCTCIGCCKRCYISCPARCKSYRVSSFVQV